MRTNPFILLLAAALTISQVTAAENAGTAPVKTEQAAKQIASGVQLLDVRTREEWEEGYIKGAKLVPIASDDFSGKATKALDPEKPVLVYCQSGGRSAKAVKLLREAGFKNVRDLDGGITAWEKEGRPVEKPAAPAKGGK